MPISAHSITQLPEPAIGWSVSNVVPEMSPNPSKAVPNGSTSHRSETMPRPAGVRPCIHTVYLLELKLLPSSAMGVLLI